jgi:predicted double-glycine peptidase
VSHPPLKLFRLLVFLVALTAHRPALAGDDVRAAGVSREQPASAASDLDRSVQRKLTICGTNALYLLLRSHGLPVTYEQVDRQVERSERGASILQLREAAKALGLATRVRRYTLDALAQHATPLIAHVNETYSRAASARRNDAVNPEGHFVLVIGADGRSVRFIDGTVGSITEYTWERFPSYWTGYVLEPVEAAVQWQLWGAVLVSAAWVAVGIAVFRPRLTMPCAGLGPTADALVKKVCRQCGFRQLSGIGGDGQRREGDGWGSLEGPSAPALPSVSLTRRARDRKSPDVW